MEQMRIHFKNDIDFFSNSYDCCNINYSLIEYAVWFHNTLVGQCELWDQLLSLPLP